MKQAWAQLRRWAVDAAKKRGVLVGVGAVALVAALIAVAPSWWWQRATAFGSGVARFWLPLVLLLAAGTAFATAAIRCWGGPWRVRRRSDWASTTVRYPLFVHVAMLLVVGVALTIGIGLLLWWLLGRPSTNVLTAVPNPSGAGGARSAWGVQNTLDAMKVVLSIVAGIGGVVALTVAYRKQDLGEAAEHREDTKLFTERFGKAADQLGSEQAAVRLAGVYAMARLADDWEQERQTCIDVLCAYLRMPYTSPNQIELVTAPNGDSDAAGIAERVLAARQEQQVRHTVIRLISAHLRADAGTNWQGHSFDFTGAVFDGGDFSHMVVDFVTMLDFSRARFTDGIVVFNNVSINRGSLSFNYAEFTGGAVKFNEAELTGGGVLFVKATFTGGTVSFERAQITGGTIPFIDAEFTGGLVTFDRAKFTGGFVTFCGAKFAGSTINFVGTEISDGTVDFSRATFASGTVAFHGSRFDGGTLSICGAFLDGGSLELQGSTISRGTIDLRKAVLDSGTIDLSNVTFAGGTVDFSEAGFTGCAINFRWASFEGSTVDISSPSSWEKQPLFTPPPDGPTLGLLLPPEEPSGS